MFGYRWRLFRLRGIPISIDASWLIVLILLSWTMGENYRAAVPGLEAGSYWLLGLVTAVAFFICIVLHELGHALVGQAMGMPFRGITLFLFGGVAELGGEPPSAGKEFAMAIAGPIVSAVLAGIFWIAARAGIQADWPPTAIIVLDTLALINLWVLIFNLVPAFPLDGGRVLRSILWGASGNVRRATFWASLLGRGFAWVLIFVGLLEFFAVDFVGGIWLVLIGVFLNNAAHSSYQQVLIRQVLGGEPVRRFMNNNPIVVPPVLDLRRWVEDYVYRYHHKTFPVSSNGQLEGVINTAVLARYPQLEWENHTVAEAMRRDVDVISVPPTTDALQALETMQRTGSSRLLVVEGGRLEGIVSLKDLLRFFQLKLELEAGAADTDHSQSWRHHSDWKHTPAHP
jgi:Zn-dependent protease/CBS domain-containing protein